MNRCLICFNAIEESLNNNCVCNTCLSKFKVIKKKIYVDNVEVFILYEYNDFFKELLYRYKGCYDYSLKDAFLNNYLLFLKNKYKKRKVICAPSFIESDKVRGYNHVVEIAKNLNLKIIDCLSKSKNYKQSSQSYNQRINIEKIIKIDKTKIKDKDKVLIVDDVTTSLSTIKTIIRLLPTNIDKKVFVLASNCRFMENEKN
jgi:predicted amidophosphoribosyltransferase